MKREPWRFRENTIENILSRCKKTEAGCLEWTGTLARNGYAKIGYQGKIHNGHRLIWRMLKGEPGDKHVCHTCDNPKCINVEHLFLGTNSENMIDMNQKGRNPLLNRTHCKYGHSLDDAKITKRGHKIRRQCRECLRAKWRKEYRKRRDK